MKGSDENERTWKIIVADFSTLLSASQTENLQGNFGLEPYVRLNGPNRCL